MRLFFFIGVALTLLSFVPQLSAAATRAQRESRIREILSTVLAPELLAATQPDGKCGTRLGETILDYWPRFSVAQQTELKILMAPQALQNIRLIGRFEVHYDTTGDQAPAMLDLAGNRIPNSAEQYVDSVGRYFNLAYQIEVDSLKYDAPPVATGHLGYEVDVVEFGGNDYGLTAFIDQVNPGGVPARWTSYIEVDNDFRGYYSGGIAGLRVTSAHEFHHTIQFGSYGFWGQQYAWFHEITSTWMEDVVHTDVNDYYNYIRTPSMGPRGTFLHPEYSLSRSDMLIEYSRAIFGKFVEQRFSAAMMRRIWEEMKSTTVLPAMNRALADSGSSFQKAFLEWTNWNYHTGRRADTVHFYREGRHYPEILERDSTYFFSPSGFFRDSVQALGSAYHPVSVNGTARFSAIVSNVNASAAIFGTFNAFTYLMSESGDVSYKHLDSLIYVKLDVADPLNWKSQESVHADEPILAAGDEAFVYPNPLFTPWPGGITFAFPSSTATTGHLLIISPAMHVVLDRDLPVVFDLNGRPSMVWYADGDAPASGVYIYYASAGDKSYRGKLSIIRR